MLDGTYTVTASTPFGRKEGTLSISGAATGSPQVGLSVAGLRLQVNRARADDATGTFELGGTIRHLLGSMDFTCTGRVEGDVLSARAVSDAATLEIRGARR